MPRVLVSIGTNQDRECNLRRAVGEMEAKFTKLRLSPVYETESVGFSGDAFLNLVASFETDLALDTLLDELRAIETHCGRIRIVKKHGPRTMDIDVLTFGDFISDEDGVEIPRSEILTQAYVLRPLADLVPDTRHPVMGESYAALRQRLAMDEANMTLMDFDPRSNEPVSP